MHRFFVESAAVSGQDIVLCGENAAHMERVLRLRQGEMFVACDGQGRDYVCRLVRFADKQAFGEVVREEENVAEPPMPIVLFQGLPKADKMELIIQKAVELGVTRIVPVAMERCVVRLTGKEAAKAERWQKIAEAAAKQSGRGRIPVVMMPVTLAQSIAEAEALGVCVAAYEDEETRMLKDVVDIGGPEAGFGVYIGPEGGFEKEEIDMLAAAGVGSVSLGKRILRTETAGLAVLAAVGCVWGI